MQILSQISLSFNEYDIAINIITKALTIRIENGIFETSVITDAVKTGNTAMSMTHINDTRTTTICNLFLIGVVIVCFVIINIKVYVFISVKSNN